MKYVLIRISFSYFIFRLPRLTSLTNVYFIFYFFLYVDFFFSSSFFFLTRFCIYIFLSIFRAFHVMQWCIIYASFILLDSVYLFLSSFLRLYLILFASKRKYLIFDSSKNKFAFIFNIRRDKTKNSIICKYSDRKKKNKTKQSKTKTYKISIFCEIFKN